MAWGLGVRVPHCSHFHDEKFTFFDFGVRGIDRKFPRKLSLEVSMKLSLEVSRKLPWKFHAKFDNLETSYRGNW